MLGGVFELLARAAIVWIFFEKYQFQAICFSDPGAWVGALIPLIPFYYWYYDKIVKEREKVDVQG